jgi:hypothetical protein
MSSITREGLIFDRADQEYEIQAAVQRASDAVYQEAAKAGSHELESLVLARVVQKLVESLVIERQADLLRSKLLAEHEAGLRQGMEDAAAGRVTPMSEIDPTL